MQGIRSKKDIIYLLIFIPIGIGLAKAYDKIGNVKCMEACSGFERYDFRYLRHENTQYKSTVCRCFVKNEFFIPELGFPFDEFDGPFKPTKPLDPPAMNNPSSLSIYNE